MVDQGYDYDELVRKAGGKYRFTSLIRRRMRELQRGMASLIEREGTLMETAIEEFRAGKIWLAVGSDADELREERQVERKGGAKPDAAPKPLPPPPAAGKP